MSAFEEKYRKRNPEGVGSASPSPSAAQVLQTAAKDEYKAFSGSAHPEFDLWVRTAQANEFTDAALPYSCRNDMMTDGSGFVISMHFSAPLISVTLHGRNLGELFQKLLRHEVVWLMEFDPRKWDTPADDAPCITGIEVKHKPLPEKTEDSALPGEKKPAGNLSDTDARNSQ
jgi:hypothetical protein